MLVDKESFQAIRSFVQYDEFTRENYSPFTTTTLYLNNSKHDVTVIERNNLPVTIRTPASTTSNFEFSQVVMHLQANKFVIRRLYKFKNGEIINETLRNVMIYNKHYVSVNREIDNLTTALNHKIKDDRFSNNTVVTIDIEVSLDELKTKRFMYIGLSDTLLQYGTYTAEVNHPFSPEGFNTGDYKALISEYKSSGVFVDIVDNDSNIGKRYSFVGSQLMEIPVRTDGTRQNGVYVTKINCERIDSPEIRQERFDLDKCEELRIYKTKEDAETGNDNNAIIKEKIQKQEMELLNKKHEINKLQQNLEESKRQFELEQLEHVKQVKQLEAEVLINKNKLQKERDGIEARVAKLKSKLEKKTAKRKNKFDKKEKIRNDHYDTRVKSRNDFYEDRSYVRKDSHELIKYLPALSIGIITGVALAIRNSKS